eukprot:1195200-Prorocentrum_minimum.AAC.2
MRMVLPSPLVKVPPVENRIPGTDLPLVDSACVAKEPCRERAVLSSSYSSSDPYSSGSILDAPGSVTRPWYINFNPNRPTQP